MFHHGTKCNGFVYDEHYFISFSTFISSPSFDLIYTCIVIKYHIMQFNSTFFVPCHLQTPCVVIAATPQIMILTASLTLKACGRRMTTTAGKRTHPIAVILRIRTTAKTVAKSSTRNTVWLNTLKAGVKLITNQWFTIFAIKPHTNVCTDVSLIYVVNKWIISSYF